MTTATVDDKKRIRLPNAKPGQVFTVEEEGEKVTLTPVKKADPTVAYANLVKRNGRLTFDLPEGCTMTDDSIERAVREERDRQAERGSKS